MELQIFGNIGTDVTLSSIAEQLKKSRGDLKIKLNSYGGDVAEGQALYNLIREYSGRVTCVIIGVCASAATLIAMASDKIIMKQNASFMIHEASVSLSQIMLRDDLAKLISGLETVNEGLITIYSARTKIPRDELRQMLKEETWMSAEEAKEKGFIDEIAPILDESSSRSQAVLKAQYIAEERARVAKLQGYSTKNESCRAIIQVAVAKGQTLEEIEPFLDAIEKMHTNTRSIPSNEFISQLQAYYDSGSAEIGGSPMQSEENRKKSARDEVIEFQKKLRGE